MLYVLTSLSVAPFLIGGLYLIDRFTPGERFTTNLPMVAALLGGVMAGLPMLRLLERGLNHVMFARQYGVRDALVALSKDLGSVLDLENLGTTLTQGLVARVPAVHASLYLWAPDRDAFVLSARALSSDAEASGAGGEV